MTRQPHNDSLLRSFGITPQTVFIFLFGIFISGVLLGLLAQNSNTKHRNPRTIPDVASNNASNNLSKKSHKENIENLAANDSVTTKTPHASLVKDSPASVQLVKYPKRSDKSKNLGAKIFAQSIKSIKINKADFPLYEQNKVLFSNQGNTTPVVAIVIDDMGVDMLKSQKMLKLPELYTFSFLTYAPNLQAQINHAKSFGTEILLHVPMEAVNNIYDYGPEYLSTKLSKDENKKILTSMLDRVSGYIGINNHMGSRFTSDYQLLSSVISELRGRGLMFLDSKTTPNSKGDEIVQDQPLPYASRDVFIDDSNRPEDIQKSLTLLENTAKKHGFAIAIAHPRENTITALEHWIPTLKDKNITSVPLSYIVDNFYIK